MFWFILLEFVMRKNNGISKLPKVCDLSFNGRAERY